MPGGLICEMATFRVIFFIFLFLKDSYKDKEAAFLSH